MLRRYAQPAKRNRPNLSDEGNGVLALVAVKEMVLGSGHMIYM
jgi:hypothetical protein